MKNISNTDLSPRPKTLTRAQVLKEYRAFYMRDKLLSKLLDPITRRAHLKTLKSMLDLSLKVRGFKPSPKIPAGLIKATK